ncbi:S-methyl-5'-thioadenosine phosphorylase [Gryllus bimaculatus]|nr:S-methyl-5'-thioadenosine phosphorylase [Gryllus bimaculatus]
MTQCTERRYTFEIVDEVANFLLSRTVVRPTVGIICGTGLGSLAEKLEDKAIFKYEDIPHFPVSSVEGHAGQLVFGRLEGVSVVCMQGRFHYYEGYPLWKCCMPVRVMKLLGVKYFIATNAAGGLNERYKVGDIMILRDHVNFMGFAGNNPLRGANDDRFGPRFPPMSKAYDPELIDVAKSVVKDMNIEDIVHEGVYTCLGGPCYETQAELRLMKLLGIDAVGMSTVHEIVTAVHCGLRCFAFSLISNECVTEYNTEAEANHEEVMDTGKMRAPILQALVAEFIKRVDG